VQRIGLYVIDLLLVVLASVLAFLLRDNFALTAEKLSAYLPHLALTALTASVVIPAFGLHRSVWRFTSMTDYLYVLAASVVIVLGAVVLGFGLNRLEGVARSIPVLQGILILLVLVGARVLMRLRHAARRAPVAQFAAVKHAETGTNSAILIVGINRLTELYLQSAQELSPGEVQVAGLVGRNERHTGRLMHRHPVLGIPEELPQILKDLQVHGVVVDRIVVTAKVESLSPGAQKVLRDVDEGSEIRVEYLAQSLGFETLGSRSPLVREASSTEPKVDRSLSDEILMIDPAEQARLRSRGYWRVKRIIDVIGALGLILLLAPIIVVVALLVLIDVGAPILFWQQRPGLGARPFKLYKLRTMGAAYDEQGRVVPDEQRLSGIGRILRRTRLDELPQLFHILFGQMSFVGPRPLLPVDQPVCAAARLLVRPGLTGWAQVKGGREISAPDKAALDVWYIRNASLRLDLEIFLRTAVMVLFGEKTHADAIRKAWGELEGTARLGGAGSPVPSLAIGSKSTPSGQRAA